MTKPLLNQKKLITCYTRQKGKIACATSFNAFPFLHSAFSHVEMIVYQRSSEIYSLQDASLVKSFDLTKNFDSLFYAGKICKALLSIAPFQTPSPLLYLLFIKFLEKLALFPHPATLSIAFQLKLLLHEGILSMQKHCSNCSEKALALSAGSGKCLSHATNDPICFNEREWDELLLLAYGKSFSAWENIETSSSVEEKIERAFLELTENTWGEYR